MVLGKGSWAQVAVAVGSMVGAAAVALMVSRAVADRRYEALEADVARLAQNMTVRNSGFQQSGIRLAMWPGVSRFAGTAAFAQPLPITTYRGCASFVEQIRPVDSRTILATGTTWTDYPGLTYHFNLERSRFVLALFQLSDVVLAVPGGYIAARLSIDDLGPSMPPGTFGNPAYTGEQERYRTVQSFWAGSLRNGFHTIRVQYKSNLPGRSNPTTSDTDGRVLYLIGLGC